MENEVCCAVVSISAEELPYGYNESEESVVALKLLISSIIQKSACDSEFTVLSNGEFGVPLWSLEAAIAVRDLGKPVKAGIVVPCDEQDMRWAEQWRDRYYTVIEKADSAPALPPEYTDICRSTEDFYDAADKYMLDNCDMMIAVRFDDLTPDIVGLAVERKMPVMFIDAGTLEVVMPEKTS